MTGRMPSQHGIHDFLAERPNLEYDWLDDEVLLSELLQHAGYRTALIGKWHCSATSLEPARGFDRWLSYDQGPEDWPNQYLHNGTVHLSDQGSPINVDGFQLEHLGRAAREFIESGDPGQPYFLVFAPTDTHEPIVGHPEQLVERYRYADLDLVPTGETSLFPAAYDAAVAPPPAPDTRAAVRVRVETVRMGLLESSTEATVTGSTLTAGGAVRVAAEGETDIWRAMRLRDKI